jgi:G3E family GTPase
MAKHFIFQDNQFYRLAPTDAKKDFWLSTSAGLVSKEVSDADYFKVAVLKSQATLNGDTVDYADVTVFHKQDTADDDANSDVAKNVTDASEAQAILTETRDNLIADFKHYSDKHYDNDAEVKAMVAFLEGIDTSAVTSFAANQSIFEYIYDLPGCPQIYPLELFY